MNKGVTILILLAVFGGMGLILYSHSTQPEYDSPALVDTYNGTDPLEGDLALNGTSGAGQQPSVEPVAQTPPRRPGLPHVDPLSGSSEGSGSPRPVVVSPSGTPVRPTLPQRVEPTPQVVPVSPSTTPLGTAPTSGDAGTSTPTQPPVTQTPATPPVGQTPPQTTTPPPGRVTGSPALTPVDLTPQAPPKVDTPPAVPETPKAAPETSVVLSPKGTHTLKGIGVAAAGQQIRLRIEAGDPFPTKSFVLSEPHRLVIDLPGTWKEMKAPQVPQNRLIKGVRLGSQPAGPRLVLDLNEAPKGHDIVRTGNVVEVLIY